MDLVHDIDPLFYVGRGVDGLIPQGPDLIYAVIGGGVQLQNIQKAAAFQPQTARTLTAGVTVYRVLTVDGLGQNFGAGGLAGTSCAGEQIGMGGTALCHLLFQGLGDVLLTDDVGKHLGPPLAVQRLIHGTHLLKNRIRGKEECARAAPKGCPAHMKTSSVCRHGTGVLAAHGTSRLMLLGSPPDMVHGAPLRETGSASASGG